MISGAPYRRSDCCILCPFDTQEKSNSGLAQVFADISNDTKTELGAFCQVKYGEVPA